MTEERKPAVRGIWLLALAVIPVVAVVREVVFQLKERNAIKAQLECIANLKQIDGALQGWALENGKTLTDTYSLTDVTILAYLKGSVLPLCPLNGTYTRATNFADEPKCSIPGHTLEHSVQKKGFLR